MSVLFFQICTLLTQRSERHVHRAVQEVSEKIIQVRVCRLHSIDIVSPTDLDQDVDQYVDH